MRVGITYDLRDDYLREGFSEEETAEFDRSSTIEAIDNTLQILGFQTERIGHVRSLVEKLADGQRWDMVFNICEGMFGAGREAQVPALLDAYQIPYVFSDPLVLALTLHKGLTKRVIRDAGIPTAPFAIVNDITDLDGLDLPYPLFAKPIGEGTGKGIDARSRIDNREALTETCERLLKVYRQPALIETYLPGREFTVGIVGTGQEAKALGTMEVFLLQQAEANAYSYVNKENCEELVKYRLCKDEIQLTCEKIALDAWRTLNCRDGGRVDLKLDARGIPNFMEVNPLAGLHPSHSDLPILCGLLGISFTSLIQLIMDSAMKRII
ncbi:MAG: D-alanine--D-alanine ligase [Bacteroidetes bacterium]|nr:D-alanine--D-alanine ligase [Bacteroidota bacterium]